MQIELLKSDAFGTIAIHDGNGQRFIRRDTSAARWWLRGLSRWAAAREARVLDALAGLDGVPRLLRWDGQMLDRGFIDGSPMQAAPPRNPRYFRDAHRLIRAMRSRGVAHNDLAKEPNWLVRPDGSPAVVDFQIAWLCSRPRRPLFRLLAREDLRHLLKHKRSYCPERITSSERAILKRRSWIANGWNATGKRVYKLVARRLFGYWDNEGNGRVRR